MKVKITLNSQEMKEILTTAIEQGSAYWMQDYVVKYNRDAEGYVESFHIKERENSDEKELSKRGIEIVSVSSLSKAIKSLVTLDGYVQVKSDILKNRSGCDSISADVLVQLEIFDEVVYG
jgi:hypothetical protein